MKELLYRLALRPGLTIEMLAATLLASILALASPLFVMQVLNRYVAHGVDTTLATLAVGVGIAVLLELGFRQIRMGLASAVNGKRDRQLTNAAFATLTNSRIAAIEQLPPGLRQELAAGADRIQAAYTAANICTVLDVPFALLFVFVLFLLSPAIALVVSLFLIFGFLISVITLASLRGPTQQLQASSSRRGNLLGAAIGSGDMVRAFNAGNAMRQQWQGETGILRGLARHIAQRQGFVQSIGMSAQALMSVGVISTGAVLVVQGQLNIGAMIGANILAARALGPVIKLASLSEPLAKARQALALFREFSKLPQERSDGTALEAFKGTVELQDMAFSHPGAKTPLFESMNLKIEPGSIVVFAGDNATGKTTLARLFAGLLEPTRGRILVDGVDLQQVAPEWWRGQISYMPQEPRFLDGSIKDNIAPANPEITDLELNRAIDMAGLRTFVDQSADGVNTRISSSAANLSLGIRRRLALARALATDGVLVLVDEPTEGLDAGGASQVVSAMNGLAQRGRTILIFSHDPHVLAGIPQYVDLNVKPTPVIVRRRTEGSTAPPSQLPKPKIVGGDKP